MTIYANVFPALQLNMAKQLPYAMNLATDSLYVGLATGSATTPWVASMYSYVTVHDFLTNGGSGAGGALTEVSTSGTNYARQLLGSVAITNSGLITTLACASPSWSATSTWSAGYAFFYDNSAAGGSPSDTTRPLLGYWDLGGASTVNAGGTFQLTVNASGLLTWTAS
jgi:hypothetical protein